MPAAVAVIPFVELPSHSHASCCRCVSTPSSSDAGCCRRKLYVLLTFLSLVLLPGLLAAV